MSEAVFLEGLFGRARAAMSAARERGPFPPRFVVEGARSMARHVGMSEDAMNSVLEEAAFHQWFLPSALGADSANFAEAGARLPESFALIRARLAELDGERQLVVVPFHMSGVALLPALVGAAWTSLRPGPQHILVGARNMSWLGVESGRWVADAGEAISADGAGLRRLVAGLRDGGIERLATLVDGPHAPGGAGVRALSGLSAGLGFRTGVLRMVLERGIPVLPIAHCWERERLVLQFGPVLRSAGEGIDAMAGMIEGMLRRHPEQWLNWTAARLRT